MTHPFHGARGRLPTADGDVEIVRLGWLVEQGIGDVSRLPHTLRILLENLRVRLKGNYTPDRVRNDVVDLQVLLAF